ncbi:MAG: cytidylate kinase-like family protein [Bacteroidales bacterium]|nr:cytidylate kinase-like family protein [Bacteroidales bacterium]MDX9771684.1 cytidylate kinase-like family protein [Tenuifilaceae bacterium]
MENLFLHYMHERVRREEEHSQPEPGPVITISREYGCYGSEIGEKLAERINAGHTPNDEWVFVSHQVLHDASEALETKPNEISHIFGAEQKTMLGDLVSLFSKDKYISDIQIKRTIAQIVRSYSEQGNAIIVGRAGCVIARHIKKSIHIRLIAPHSWRVNVIKKRFNLTTTEATSLVNETDKRRDTFMEFFRGNKPDNELFDLMLNRSRLSTEEIVEQIYTLAKERSLF